MAKKSSAKIGFEKQIWDAACELWGHIPAADYRKVMMDGKIYILRNNRKYTLTGVEVE